MPPPELDASDWREASAKRRLRSAARSEDLAEDARQWGPFEDGTTAEDFESQAAELRRGAVRLRVDAAKAHRGRSTRPRWVRRLAPRGGRRNVRTGPRRSRAPASSSEEPEPDPIRLAAASARLWAHVRRREAHQRLAAWRRPSLIRLALESRPRVLVDALDESEFARLLRGIE